MNEETEDIADYRKMIDSINRELVDAIARRTDIAQEIGRLKDEQGRGVTDEDREAEIHDQFRSLFREHDLPQEKADDLADILITIATEAQQ